VKSFKGKVVVITGGATGIGFGLAKSFGRQGAKVVIASRRRDRVRDSVETLKGMGIEAQGTTCDVSDYDSVQALADFGWEAFGRVDVLVNNAGVGPTMRSLFDLSEDQFDKGLRINLYGTWHGVKAFGQRFLRQGTPCAIYNIGSEMSLFSGVPRGGEYVIGKHALLGLTELLRQEAPEFMDVGFICPGFVSSEIGGGKSIPSAMPTDQFVETAMAQIRAGEFYIVSHAYNMVHIDKRYAEISKAYERFAPRYPGDDEYDVGTLMGW